MPLNYGDYAFFAARYRALRHTGKPLVMAAVRAGAVTAAGLVIGVAFLGIGAPLWLAAIFAVVGALLPPIVARRERRRAQELDHVAEAA